MPLYPASGRLPCGCWSVIQWLPRYSRTARGYADAEIGGWLQERLRINSRLQPTALTDTPRPQVVYLDPMFHISEKRY